MLGHLASHLLPLLRPLLARETDCNYSCTAPDAVHVIVSRASTEPPGTGIMGVVANATAALIPGSDVVALDYPAILQPYQPSEPAGVANLTKLVEEYALQCPLSKMVLMGYSQGAQVTADTLCGTSEAGFNSTPPLGQWFDDRITAVVLMGDPSFVKGQPWDNGTAQNVSFFPRQDNQACAPVASKMVSYCNAGDYFCDSGGNLTIHLSYVQVDGANAVDFVVRKWRESLPWYWFIWTSSS